MKKTVTALLIPAFILIMAASPSLAAEKSRSTALLLSLVVPGLGQYYAGSPGSAKLFIAAELAFWGGYYYNSSMKESRRDDYLRYAWQHAGVNPSGQGVSYLGAIGSFNSSFDYNGYALSTEENPILYSGDTAWNWDSDSSRARFHTLRENELDFDNSMKYCVGGNSAQSSDRGTSRVEYHRREEPLGSFHCYTDRPRTRGGLREEFLIPCAALSVVSHSRSRF